MPEVKPVPDGYPSLTPYLIVTDGAAAIAFYQRVFGAKLRMRLDGPGGKIGHAELEIGNSLIMLADEHPAMGALAPLTIGGTPVGLHIYVEDVDAVAAKAIAAGAAVKRPSRTSSTATGSARSSTRSGISGTSRPMLRMCHPRRSAGAPPKR
jgi:PhnB protein